MTGREPPVLPELPTLTLRPIGIVHSPFTDRLSAPRQPRAAEGVQGTLELLPHLNYQHALEDLQSFRFIWVLFWFHKNQGFRPKVQPPRSQSRRGVFATRSPYRPNPIGMSAVELLGVEGLTLRVQNLDILDGTPILDLKPYIPYTDSIPGADNGWLEEPVRPPDPIPEWPVEISAPAREQLEFLERHAVVLGPQIEDVLRLGPAPHPYRRIKPNGSAFTLAYKAWRIDFSSDGQRILVLRIRTGYRPSEIATSTDVALDLHRSFIAAFGEARPL
jgi:tRNA-Thr(GGU) m(6)t(6)A37 methyltransferase TsaA